MWIVRFVLLGFMIVAVSVSVYLMSHRQKYQGILENRVFNVVFVVVYNLLCYLMAGLPSDPSVISPPGFWAHPTVRTWFSIIGFVTIGAGLLVAGISVRQRKTVGGENVKEGLLTSGVYHYFRHPIYAGIIGISLGVALVASSWDGLLMLPAVIALNIVEAVIEERCDIGKRFPSQYQEYRKRTRLLGPIWGWAALLGLIFAVTLTNG